MICLHCGKNRHCERNDGCGTLGLSCLGLSCLGIAGWIGAAIVVAVFLLDYIKK